MRTFILAKAYKMLLSDNSNSNFEKAKELINLVGEFDKQQKELNIYHDPDFSDKDSEDDCDKWLCKKSYCICKR